MCARVINGKNFPKCGARYPPDVGDIPQPWGRRGCAPGSAFTLQGVFFHAVAQLIPADPELACGLRDVTVHFEQRAFDQVPFHVLEGGARGRRQKDLIRGRG